LNYNIYKEIVLFQTPRILGLGDRNESSKTFGCFDRYYWHYKLLDISNARFQESSFLLALLYCNNFDSNIFYKNQSLFKWAEGGIKYWAEIQRKNGSFDEVYPFENSFVATAFSTCAITESMLAMNTECCLENVVKAGKWLSRNDNFIVANQMAGALLALYNIFLLTEDERFLMAANDKLKNLLALQTIEGFFPEYGGYDIGYLSITISYMAAYYKKTQKQNIYDSIIRAIDFIEGKIQDDGSHDYTQTSRGTQYLYPYGFTVMNRINVLEKQLNGLEKNSIINPSWMDDRFCIPLTIDYLQTYLEIPNENDNT